MGLWGTLKNQTIATHMVLPFLFSTCSNPEIPSFSRTNSSKKKKKEFEVESYRESQSIS
jgi:hypothetical protein